VLQPIAAFVYCSPRQQQAVASAGGRQKSEIFMRHRRLRKINSAHGRGFAKIIL